MKTYKEHLEELGEKVERKKVFRDGKLKRIKKSSKAGFKIKDGREVKQSAKEKIARRKAAKKIARKNRNNKSALRKRLRSAKKSRRLNK